MIYLYLRGRIGNQLFEYAFAKRVSEENNDPDIVIDDAYVIKSNYENSIQYYSLPNVRYVHTHARWALPRLIGKTSMYALWRIVRKFYDYNGRYRIEERLQPFFNKHGLIMIENGYMDFKIPKRKTIFIDGYYQSEKFFKPVEGLVRKEYVNADWEQVKTYPGIEKIRNRNSVCISIKVQHNVGNKMYDVCNDGYWKEAIQYIYDTVENPLFLSAATMWNM